MMSAGIRYNEDQPYKDNDITYHSLDLRKAALDNTAVPLIPQETIFYTMITTRF